MLVRHSGRVVRPELEKSIELDERACKDMHLRRTEGKDMHYRHRA